MSRARPGTTAAVAVALLALVLMCSGAARAATLGAAGAKAAGPLRLGPNIPAPSGAAPFTSNGFAPQRSYNWSGYVAGNGSDRFTLVSSTYIQPTVTCPVAGAHTVFWVGLDGWSDHTVEQDGTLAVCEGAGSEPAYYAWWEMVPANEVQRWFPVHPGDKIKASVRYSRGRFKLSVNDATAKIKATTVQTCAGNVSCERSSAEWIIERPGYGGTNFAPLADWGTAAASSDEASSGGGRAPISAFPYTPLDMVSTSPEHLLASVEELDARGNAFEDTWLASS